MSSNQTQAIIIGSSIAGMLSARVLSERFDHVLIIERDSLPDVPEQRNGVPQGRHLHVLLSKGQGIMEDLFPGLGAELTEAGAPLVHWGRDTLLVVTGGELPRIETGTYSHLTPRLLLEYLIRTRMKAIDNVTFMEQTQVNGLIAASGKITGLNIQDRRTKIEDIVFGDLIVDASGRGSKTPEWFKALGYAAPEETFIDAKMGYATRWYTLPDNYETNWKSIAIQPDAPSGNYRAGGVLRQDGKRYVLTLQGSNGEYPPTDETEFVEFAKNLPTSHMYDFIQRATPISPIYGYRRTQNRLRHYEKLSERPENYIILGDAACAFNPIYGQGMSIAAMEVLLMRDILAKYSVRHLEGFAEKFQKQMRHLIESSWTFSTAEDLRYPLTEGDDPGFRTRFTQLYTDWVADTMVHDQAINRAFLKVFNLEEPTTYLVRPQILSRVLWHKFIRPKKQRPVQTETFIDWQPAQSVQ